MNTKFFKIAFLIVVVFILSCKSSEKIADSNTEVKAQVFQELDKSLLWKIEGKTLTEPSYLFGTIHLIGSEDFFWPKGTLAAFEESESVVFEIDMDDMFDIGTQLGLMSKAFMNDGQKLSDLYSDEDYRFVKAHFEEMGIPFFFLERLKPMFLTVFASGDIEIGAGFGDGSSMKSYEMELFELSQQSSKEVHGLETIEYQMSVFDSIPYSDQAEMLIETIRSSDTADDSFKLMAELYRSQDINKMVSAMSEEEGIGEYEDILLIQRNKNWIPVMEAQMKEGQVFFAVGAGHLGGMDGVVTLLRKAGYKLTPLSKEGNG